MNGVDGVDGEADVVVVGGGPVGLFLAAELGLAGVSVTLVEKLDRFGRADNPALRGITTRTMRTLALRELDRPIVAAAEQALHALIGKAARPSPGQVASTTLGRSGITKGHLGMVPLTDPAGEFTDVALLPVPYATVREVFAERATRHGVRIIRGRAVLDLTAGPQEVMARLDDGQRIRGRYLVGADGGRSTVRRLAGFDFPGTDPALFAVGGEEVTLRDKEKLPQGFTRTPRGVLMVDVVPGQVVAIEHGAPPASPLEPATRAELETILRRVSGTDVTVGSARTLFRYSDNARQSSTYRRGRVLLVGDAAHVHSPFGGQGINLGVQDAANLGWKLAGVLRGTAPAELLDTYTAERHPVGARVLRNSRAQSALLRYGPDVDALRELLTDLVELPEARAHLIGMVHALDITYGAADGHPLVGAFICDAVIASAGGLADGRGLLVGPADLRGLAARYDGVRWAEGRCRTRPEVAALLVRPDGYVAWARNHGDDQNSPSDALHRWFGPAR